MATEQYVIEHDWTQVTSGTESALLQVLTGAVQLCDSESAPVGDVPAHYITDFLNINAPVKAWVRAFNYPQATIVITTAE